MKCFGVVALICAGLLVTGTTRFVDGVEHVGDENGGGIRSVLPEEMINYDREDFTRELLPDGQEPKKPATKRRRLRKRKKRPPPINATQDQELQVATLPPPRRKVTDTVSDEESSSFDLKSILKQNGGLSLSEILQKKNVTLSELLKGNKKAISALKEQESTTTESINRNFEQEGDSFETQPLRVRTRVTQFEVVTEPTTERRIFVPYHPVYYTSVDVKPEFYANTPSTISKPTTERFEKSPVTNSKLPVTNAKLKKLITNVRLGDMLLPPKATKIDVSEIFGYKTTSDDETQKSGPLKLTIGFEELPQPEKATTETINEKIKPLSAREEIMAILERPEERRRILRILEIRNMTVEELIEQRERGSSQIHLADIFHNEQKEPEPDVAHVVSAEYTRATTTSTSEKPSAMDIEQIISEEFGVLPALVRRQKVLQQTTTEGSKTTLNAIIVTSFPSVKIETLSRKLYPDIDEDDDMIILESNLLDADLRQSENTNSKLYITSEQLQLQDEVYVNIPSGVKSAVLASLAILGLSILVFLTIMFVFRWTQKRKQAINYCSGFRSKMKSPFFEVPHRNIKNFMTETLGKRKNYYENSLQTISNKMYDGKVKAPF